VGASSPGPATAGPADYARACVDQLVRGRAAPAAPRAPLYVRPAACFVSLKKHGVLRGCIGTLEPAEPDLGQEIARNACSSAFNDPRFPAVAEEELEALTCSVDVLGPCEPCELTDLDPAVYGIVVHAGVRRGVLLPDLQGVETVSQQVRIALQKAGIRQDEPFTVERFTVTRYREGEAPGAVDVEACGAADGAAEADD
jgi:AmmeMemoRadiSam system protein A